MYKIKVQHLEFIGYEDDCWKFLLGFLGYRMRDTFLYDIMEADGKYCDYGLIEIEEV